MLFSLLKELVDRFIEFLLRMSKGETPEVRLTSVLKSTVTLVSVLIFALVSMFTDNLNLRHQLDDYDSVASKVGFLLDPSNRTGVATEISKLTASIENTNALLRKENAQLTESNINLSQENYWIQTLLARNMKEMKRLATNNDVLLMKCVGKGTN